MKHRNPIMGGILVVALTACGMESAPLPDPRDVEGVISGYYDDIAAYDYAAMQAAYTPELIVLNDGRRIDGAEMEEIVRGLQARNVTREFELSAFDTEVAPDVAYTSYVITAPPDLRWYGSASLKRSGEAWLIDQLVMMDEAAQAPAAQPATDEAEPQYRISQITGDLYRFQNGGHYSVFLVTPEGIITTDPVSEFGEEPALWLKEQFAERFGVPVRYVIYSHHHLDHAAGGDVFADTAEFVAHENTARKFETPDPDAPLAGFAAGMDRDGDQRVSREEGEQIASRFDGWDANGDGFLDVVEVSASIVRGVRPPDTVYSDRMTIELGGKTVELVHPGPNHSDDMTVVYFPEERVVFGADFLGAFSGIPGGNFAGSAMTDWINSYKSVEALDFDIVAPGHGPMARKADVTLTRMAWEDLHEAVATGIAEGRSVEELQASVTLDDYMHHPSYEERLQASIAEAYRSITAHE